MVRHKAPIGTKITLFGCSLSFPCHVIQMARFQSTQSAAAVGSYAKVSPRCPKDMGALSKGETKGEMGYEGLVVPEHPPLHVKRDIGII